MTQTDIVSLFRKETPLKIESKNTSRPDGDFRETLFVTFSGEKIVIKLADNDFTDETHLAVWEKTAACYRDLGYYTPRFYRALDGTYPRVAYQGHNCVAWAEEFSKYRSAAEVIRDRFPDGGLRRDGYYAFFRDAVRMNARAALSHYDFSPFPSAYCMFETFSPSDITDETTEDAMRWKKEAEKLPPEFSARTDRVWRNWQRARQELQSFYPLLPTSVFQADINDTNILLDEEGNFRGVCDFNIAGREVFVNLLVREIPYVTGVSDEVFFSEDHFSESIRRALSIAGEIYPFNELEIRALPLLYRCIRPLWWHSAEELSEAAGDKEKISRILDAIEYEQTREIDFATCMREKPLRESR